MKQNRTGGLFLAAVVLAGSTFIGGRLAEVSMRDPRALVTLVVMVFSFLAVLFLAS